MFKELLIVFTTVILSLGHRFADIAVES